MSKFSELGLSDQILEQVTRAGFDQPTPIQELAIPNALMNRDIVGIAQTGTGKTAAFVLPLLDILTHARQRAGLPRALILNPTRELAMQTAEVIETFSANNSIKHTLLIGGMTMGEQIQQLAKAPDVIIATPGRLLDLQERGKIMLNAISVLVLDEADRMLDMGFIPEVEKICSLLSAQRQTLLMSATMDTEVGKLVEKFTKRAKYIDLSPQKRSAETVQEQFIPVENEKQKISLLVEELKNRTSALIFCNRRQRVREVTRMLTTNRAGRLDDNSLAKKIGQLHGDMPQPMRIAELEKFRKGVIKFLICSDVAARGLDIEAVDCVINFDLPTNEDNYVHRIGRTGRAGLKGSAITYLSEDDKIILERNGMLEQVEKAIGKEWCHTKDNHRQALENTERKINYRQNQQKNRNSSERHSPSRQAPSGQAPSRQAPSGQGAGKANSAQGDNKKINKPTMQPETMPAFLRNPV